MAMAMFMDVHGHDHDVHGGHNGDDEAGDDDAGADDDDDDDDDDGGVDTHGTVSVLLLRRGRRPGTTTETPTGRGRGALRTPQSGPSRRRGPRRRGHAGRPSESFGCEVPCLFHSLG